MAWSDGLIAAALTRYPMWRQTALSAGNTNVATDTQNAAAGFNSGGTSCATSTSTSFNGSFNATVRSSAGASDGTTSEGASAGAAVTSGQTGSFSNSASSSAAWVVTIATTGVPGTITSLNTDSGSSSTSGTFDLGGSSFTLFQCTGTSSQTTTYSRILSTVTTATFTAPSTTGSPPSTTTVTTSFSLTSNTTDTGTSSFQGAAGVTLSITNGIAPEFYDFTYFVPAGSVAWVITGTDTNDGLIDLTDQADSFTDSFTLPFTTGTSALSGVEWGTDTPAVTFSAVGVAGGASVNATRAYLTTQSTTYTFSTIDQVPNATLTSTTSTGSIGTFTEIVTVNFGTAPDTDHTFSAIATDRSLVVVSILSSYTAYVVTSDSRGRPAGFEVATLQDTIYVTASTTIAGAAGTFTSSQTDTSGGESDGTAAGGVTFEISNLLVGFVPANTQGVVALDPALPGGVCIPTGAITARVPHNLVSAGAITFPAPYCIGMQTGVSGPLLENYLTTTDTAGNTWQLSYNGASVTGTKIVGTLNSTFSGVIVGVGPKTDRFYSMAFPGSLWTLFGGATPDGRTQKVMFGPAIIDATNVDGSTHDGTVNTSDATTLNAAVSTGLAVNLLPAYNIAYGPDPSPAVFFPAYS